MGQKNVYSTDFVVFIFNVLYLDRSVVNQEPLQAASNMILASVCIFLLLLFKKPNPF